MSKVRDANFVVLTGHLNDYPLADLIAILRRQRKTGRLLVEYPVSPCAFYFKEGHLVDAQLNTFAGLQAFFVALSQPNAAFNFNPLIEAPRRSINETSQKVILELLGCQDEKTVNVEPSPAEVEQAISTISAQAYAEPIDADLVAPEADVQPTALPPAREVLALPPAPGAQTGGRKVVIISALVSLLVSLLTVAALTAWAGRRGAQDSAMQAAAGGTNQGAADAANGVTVRVTLRVEAGRVTQADVADHRPGMESFESMALRIARERRYPPNASGQETVPVTIVVPR